MLPAHIGGRHSGRVLLQHPDDLLFGKSALAHVHLLEGTDSTQNRGHLRGAGQEPCDVPHDGHTGDEMRITQTAWRYWTHHPIEFLAANRELKGEWLEMPDHPREAA